MAIMSSLLCKIFRTHELTYSDLTFASIGMLIVCGMVYLYAINYDAFVEVATYLGVVVIGVSVCIGMSCDEVAVVCPKYKK